MEHTGDTLLVQMTEGDLRMLINSEISCQLEKLHLEKLSSPRIEDNLCKGLQEASDFLGITRQALCRLKTKGLFDGAFVQTGHIIIFYKDKMLECMRRDQEERNRPSGKRGRSK